MENFELLREYDRLAGIFDSAILVQDDEEDLTLLQGGNPRDIAELHDEGPAAGEKSELVSPLDTTVAHKAADVPERGAYLRVTPYTDRQRQLMSDIYRNYDQAARKSPGGVAVSAANR